MVWMGEIVYIVQVRTWDALLRHILDASDRITNNQRELQQALFTTERRSALRQRLRFSKTCFKQGSLSIKANFMNVDLYVKFIM
jgi:hypothetical protein